MASRRGEFPSVRKASSHDHLGSPSPLRSGGVSLESRHESYGASPTPTAQRNQRKTASDDGTPKSTNSSAFLIGSSPEDDIFTEASSETAAKPNVTNTDTQLQVFNSSPAKVDAQGIYPGTACMFVANLSQPYEDKVLEFEVTKAFSKFGEVWVKIKRDGYQMPFAFCQFTNDHDAQKAEKFGKGMKILGRPCRTEMARAQSSFLVSKRSGMATTIAEATTLLSQLGEVAKAEFVEEGAQRTLGVPPSVLVTYKMYDSRREPVRYFDQNPTFLVMANNPRRHNDVASSATKWDGGDALMQKYDKDRRSAYVGNLPIDMAESVLRALASSSGEVLGVQMYKRDVLGKPGQINCFAFVEFARPDGADDLITTMNNTEIDGKTVRVERKHSRTFETPRRDNKHHDCWTTLPRRRGGNSFAAVPASNAEEGVSAVQNDESHVQSMAYNKSFSYGQNRCRRETIFNADTSIGKAMSSLESPSAKLGYAPVPGLGRSQHADRAVTSSSKKSVEFEVPRGTRSDNRPLTPTGNGVDGNHHVADPCISDTGSGTAAAVNTAQTAGHPATPSVMMPPPSFGWTPFYQPFPQAYPYMPGPFTPQQQGHEVMQQFISTQYPHHPAMFYNNMMLPTPPMMAHHPMPTGHAAGRGQNNESTQRHTRHESS